ncbi:MAG: hypothetical protein MK214_17675 [Thalassotalea sp.]|nr:hypothetical protein [Thalassotalea sp.]
MNEKEQELSLLYQRYIQAFAQYDIAATRQCYQLPCILSTPEKVLVIKSEEDFECEFTQIFSMLRSNNISGFKASNASFEQVDDNIYLAHLDWQFFDDANNLFTEFAAIYHLSYQNQAYRIISVISHDIGQSPSFTHSMSIFQEESSI